MTLLRSEVEEKYLWDLTPMYSSWDAWKKEIKIPDISQIEKLKNSLNENKESVKKVLDTSFALARAIDKLYTYAHLQHDSDGDDEEGKKALQEALQLATKFQSASSWIEPEILKIKEEVLRAWLQEKDLADYKVYLHKLLEQKQHVLSQQEERLLADVSMPLDAASRAFRSYNDIDLKFPPAIDKDGKEQTLTHGTFSLMLKSMDRALRKSAFENVHATYKKSENLFAELLSGEIQAHFFYAKARKYANCLQAALAPHQIDTSVVVNLIKTVRSKIGALHKYVALRKKVAGLEQMHLFDMHFPLVGGVDTKISIEEAKQIAIDSTKPLGEAYQSVLEKGINQERWLDCYETKSKRSGAYSSGCYDSHPYILLNFKGTSRDLSTLCHEIGHSMHSHYSRTHQQYPTSRYSIFVAEVASTLNEQLLFNYMMEHAKTSTEKAYLLQVQIEDLRATLFRQVMFAEFELKIHEMIEQGAPVTASILSDLFLQLNKDYFGPDVVIDDLIAIEWARIPHFYYNFYVYQYATGISAAIAFAKPILANDEAAKDRYLDFLKAGSSDFPIEILKKAGVDMSQPEPISAAIDHFEHLLELFNEQLNQ